MDTRLHEGHSDGSWDSVSYVTASEPAKRLGLKTSTLAPDEAGVYIIYDRDECIYVGMAGRAGRGLIYGGGRIDS